MRKMTGIGLGVLLLFAVSEAGAVTAGAQPAVPPVALESGEETLQVADRKSSKSRVRSSREERRQKARDRVNSPRTRKKSRTR
jgi:hypothetical protein